WMRDYETSNVSVVQGARFECRIRVNETGFEIRFNGRFAHFYKHRVPSRKEYQFLVVKHNLEVFEYRIQKELTVPYYQKFTEPLMIGDFIYINGIMRGNFAVFLQNEEGNSFQLLSALLETSTVRICAVLKQGTNAANSSSQSLRSFSLKRDVEFEIVIANKFHAMEYYVNGELLTPVMIRAPDVAERFNVFRHCGGKIEVKIVAY
ncbi:hypothetical protein PMAYCL1PPCAC_09482, partial [Pristionchus mayeri]